MTATQPTTTVAPGDSGTVEFFPPRSRTAPSWLGLVLAVLLIGLGVVLLHDALVHLGTVGGDDWITTVTDATGTVRPTNLVAGVGGVLVVVGIMLLLGAFRPRRRLGAAVASGNGQYLMPGDVARLASSAARRVDGVLEARSTASTRRVTVVAHTTGDAGTSDAIRQAVTPALAILDSPPGVKVRTRSNRDGRAGT